MTTDNYDRGRGGVLSAKLSYVEVNKAYALCGFMPHLFLTLYMPSQGSVYIHHLIKVLNVSHDTCTAMKTKEIMLLSILPG
jgi:hypothetical protein